MTLRCAVFLSGLQSVLLVQAWHAGAGFRVITNAGCLVLNAGTVLLGRGVYRKAARQLRWLASL